MVEEEAGLSVLDRERTPIPIAAKDPVVYLAVGLLLAGVGVAAMLTPAVHAAKAGPMQALRQDSFG